MVTALIITRAVHIAASMLLAGTFTFDLIVLGLTDRSVSNDLNDVEHRLMHLAFWSLIPALLSALFWFWLEVASMSELSLKNALSAMAWGTVLFETQFGRVWQLRLGLIATAFVLVLVALAVTQVKARSALIAVLWLVSMIVLVSLTIFLTRVRRSFSLGQAVVRVVRRFSTLSLCCVTVLIVSGISNSWLLVGSIHALFTTPYG